MDYYSNKRREDDRREIRRFALTVLFFLGCLALIAVLTGCSSAHAAGGNYTTGNKLYATYRTDQGYFIGYVAGVRDANRLVECSPETVLIGQMGDVVHQYLERNPAWRHLDADVLVLMAIREAWPCPTPPPAPAPSRQSL